MLIPITLFAYGIHHRRLGLIRFSAFLTVGGIILNRLNTALITFNWQLYQEWPHYREVIIVITVVALYATVYRFILYRLPILYEWKAQPQEAEACEKVRVLNTALGAAKSSG